MTLKKALQACMITLSILTLERLSITFTADGKRQGRQLAVCRRRPKPGVNSLKAGIHKKPLSNC